MACAQYKIISFQHDLYFSIMELGVQMLIANSLPWTQTYAKPAYVDKYLIGLDLLYKVL